MTYIQPNTASLERDDHDLRSATRSFELGHRSGTLLDIHRAVEAVRCEVFALEGCFDQVEDGRELREDDSAEARVLIL